MAIVRSPMTLVMLVIFTLMVAVASTYPADARFMPFVVGIPAIMLCVLQLFLDWRTKETEAISDNRSEMEKAEERVSKMVGHKVDFEVAKEAPDVTIIENSDEVARDREFIIWAYVLAFVGGILVFGFWLAIPIFIAIFLNREAQYSIQKAALYALMGGGIMFAIFSYGLKLRLHTGFIMDWLF